MADQKSSDPKNELSDLMSNAFEELKMNSVEAKPSSSKEPPKDVSFEETLKMINESLAQVPNESKVPEEKELEEMFQEFASAFGPIDGASAAQDCNNFLPVMESMMKSILSKDLLYPPLKDLCEKYPDWLADNREKLGEDAYDQYNKQYLVAKEIVGLFESQDEKSQFDKIFELMQKMQTFGHPPKELIGDAPDLLDPSNPMKDCNVQ